jgi:hypothetical protein
MCVARKEWLVLHGCSKNEYQIEQSHIHASPQGLASSPVLEKGKCGLHITLGVFSMQDSLGTAAIRGVMQQSFKFDCHHSTICSVKTDGSK